MKKWPVPLAESCPTADRSRTMAQKRGPVSCWTRSRNVCILHVDT